jgi:formiminoglutamase
MIDLTDFLSPINIYELNGDNEYTDGQFAKIISVYEKELPDLTDIELVLVGIGESRGVGFEKEYSSAPDKIRKQFYPLHLSLIHI